MEQEELDKAYFDIGSSRREGGIQEIEEYMTFSYPAEYCIYVTKVENGTFRLVFAGYNC